MKKYLNLLLTLLPLAAHSWIPSHLPPSGTTTAHDGSKTSLTMSTEQNPCWQDLYDEDCSMENAYAANFVASEWLKSMPCAEGIADCDMPEDLQLPGNRHSEEVDVMEFLNIKRAKGVAGSDGDSISP